MDLEAFGALELWSPTTATRPCLSKATPPRPHTLPLRMLPSCIPLSTPFYHHPCGLPNATTAMLPPTVPTPATSLPDCVSSIRAASSKESRQRNLKALHPVHSSSIQFSHSPMPHFPCQPTWAPPLQDSSTLWTNRRLHQPSTQRCPTCSPHTPPLPPNAKCRPFALDLS